MRKAAEETAGRAWLGGKWGRILQDRPSQPERPSSFKAPVGARPTGGVRRAGGACSPGSAESRRLSFLGRGPRGSFHLSLSFKHLHGASLLFHSSHILHPSFFPLLHLSSSLTQSLGQPPLGQRV